jgi:hypothetical protein
MTLPELKFSEVKQLCSITGATPTELPSLFDDGDWVLLDDDGANDMVKDYIRESLWAFNPEFLAGETGLSVEVFRAIQANDQCESNNEAIEAMVQATCGVQSLVDSAISADGRGHFLSSYDGNEYEVGGYFLYRMN